MTALKSHRPWGKKQKSNPYAERGLDQFALVSAELQAARDTLVAQLGTQLSLVRFASGSEAQREWIPIIVAPTSSKAEMRALRRAASDLVSGPKHAFEAKSFGHHTGSSVGEYDTDGDFGKSDTSVTRRDENAHMGSTISAVGIDSSSVSANIDVGSNAISKHDNRTGVLGYLIMATQGFVWVFCIAAFGFRILADAACEAVLSLRHTDKNVINIGMASSSDTSSPAQPTMIAQRDIKRTTPPLCLHVKASKTDMQSRFVSTPSSPRDSQELTKALAASISLPKTAYLNSHTLHNNMKEKNHAQKTNPNRVMKSSALKVGATASKISPEDLGRALSATGVVLVLGGLVMGFVPAIAGVICWWYALPIVRKAVGDKPSVRSHHGSQEDSKSNSSSKKEAKSTIDVKNDMQDMKLKKKVIMDGLLERPRHRPHV